jgi:hypothetical protein
VFSSYLEFRTMDQVQKLRDAGRSAPSSETSRFYGNGQTCSCTISRLVSTARLLDHFHAPLPPVASRRKRTGGRALGPLLQARAVHSARGFETVPTHCGSIHLFPDGRQVAPFPSQEPRATILAGTSGEASCLAAVSPA